MFEPEIFEQVLLQYINVRKTLKSLGVARNKKSIESQIGEWLVSKLYNGVVEENPNNPDWDVVAGGKRIQVKTHAKASTNNSSYTKVSFKGDAQIDILIIIVFTEDLKLKHFFNVTKQEAIEIKGGKDRLCWKALLTYDIPLDSFSDKETIKMFT